MIRCILDTEASTERFGSVENGNKGEDLSKKPVILLR
jgi:hypothetical protein